MPHPFSLLPLLPPSRNSHLPLQPSELKENIQGENIYVCLISMGFRSICGFGLEEGGGGRRPPHPSSSLIVWCTSHICVCKTKKAERCGVHWLRGSDKWMNRLFIVSDRLVLFFFTPVFFFHSGGHCLERSTESPAAETQTRPVLCESNRADTRAPLYCSYRWAPTPNHQLPQCTRLTRRRDKKKITATGSHDNALYYFSIYYNFKKMYRLFFFRKVHTQMETWRRSTVNGRIHHFR